MSERTLLVTAGSTPQVITETIWALAMHNPPWMPDRIVLAATAAGARLYQEGKPDRGLAPLLGEEGRLAALFAALAPGRPMPEVELLLPSDGSTPVADLRTAREVELFAEALLERVAQLTEGETGELHLSLAGGRKTMSFLAGQVLTLVGRRQDRLSHVLVEPAEFESRPDFWWPGDGSPGSGGARVLLHEVPYVRARAWVDVATVLRGPGGERFRSAVARANLGLGEPDLCLDLGRSILQAGDVPVELAPQEAGLLALIFVAALRGAELSAQKGWDRDAPSRLAPALDGDRPAGTALWAWLTAAAQLKKMYEDEAVVSFDRFDRAIGTLVSTVDHATQNNPPLARMRAKLREALSPALANRILLPRGLSTAMPPERLEVLVPTELADHPDRPPEVRLAGA
ncbi:MAG: CRISPR-associated ring nuclease Csm6 [Sphingomonadaceae bacterium]